MTENEGPKEEKLCPRCALENIKSKLKRLSNDILQCVKCNWLESDINTKLIEPFKCPRCAIEGIKSDLKNYPSHLLTCSNCQWLGKQIGGRLVESLI
jgi:ssDNA-binding Zn-finger/Zn-ribbon topoisomerase 1